MHDFKTKLKCVAHVVTLHTCTCTVHIVHGLKGKFGRFKSSSISKIGKATPTKIGVHALNINPYLHEFFEPIPIN